MNFGKMVAAMIDTTPRVRGLQSCHIHEVCTARYNPACAGTTLRSRTKSIWCTIQPRVCGDYSVLLRLFSIVTDTTPRVRGLLYAHFFRLRNWRYNPACAGTTTRSGLYCSSPSIQPRVCGDYAARSVLNGLAVDTTPRVRGLRKFDGVGCQHIRYNPACAGTTGTNKVNKRIGTIQPRVCGDYFLSRRERQYLYDTTPRVRGLLISRFLQVLFARYNPACAGTTALPALPARSPEIQPRVCGDYCDVRERRYHAYDTTPRVRGLQWRGDARPAAIRYNPACAGTT